MGTKVLVNFSEMSYGGNVSFEEFDVLIPLGKNQDLLLLIKELKDSYGDSLVNVNIDNETQLRLKVFLNCYSARDLIELVEDINYIRTIVNESNKSLDISESTVLITI